jgi:hypothetical protein
VARADRCAAVVGLEATHGVGRDRLEHPELVAVTRITRMSRLVMVSHLRQSEFASRRRYRFLDNRTSASGRWEMRMDGCSGQAVQ